MAIMKVICKNCEGRGNLPALGNMGNPLDVKRFFPRPCDPCGGIGLVLDNVVVTELKPQPTVDYDPCDD